MTPVLEVTRIRRAFAEGRGLFGVDLQIAAGEIYSLVGPNGAGKTSLIRAITGRLRLESGSVRVGGADPKASTTRRTVGLVPQEIALYGDLPVATNLVLLGQLAGMGRAAAQASVTPALEWIDLADRADSIVRELSGGQQRRVNLAAGTLHSPTLLILDEPTVGVDPVARDRIHAVLLDLKARGVAILLATHDLAEASALADRVGVLVRGAIRAEGRVSELVREHVGEGTELVVRLATSPDEGGRRFLAERGLAPGSDDQTWQGTITGVAALPTLVAALGRAGLQVAESVTREPSLASVFRRVAGGLEL